MSEMSEFMEITGQELRQVRSAPAGRVSGAMAAPDGEGALGRLREAHPAGAPRLQGPPAAPALSRLQPRQLPGPGKCPVPGHISPDCPTVLGLTQADPEAGAHQGFLVGDTGSVSSAVTQ